MAVADEPREQKSGISFMQTDSTLPRITAVFSARKDGCFVPYNSNFDAQQSSTRRFSQTEPYESDRSGEVKTKPWPRIEFPFECERRLPYSFSGSESSPAFTPASKAAVNNNTPIYIEAGFASTSVSDSCRSAGGLVAIERGGHLIVQDLQAPKTTCSYGEENMLKNMVEQRAAIRSHERHSYSCLDELKNSIPCRFDLRQEQLQKILDSNFSETIELYKRAAQCEIGSRPLLPFLNRQGSTSLRPVFSWEEIKHALENDTCVQVKASLLADLIDLQAISLISNRRNYVYGSGPSSSSLAGWSCSSTKTSSSSYDFNDGEICKSSDICTPKGPLTQTKNATSIPYGENHMETMLRSSKTQSLSHSPKAENQTDAAPQLTQNHYQTTKSMEKRADVYLGRYPCLRDVSYVTTTDDSNMVNNPIVFIDDSSEESPEVIIRPRPHSETFEHSYEYDKEDFQSHFPPTCEPTQTVTSPAAADVMFSLPAHSTSHTNRTLLDYDSKSLPLTVANIPGFRPIAPKTEGSDVSLATTSLNVPGSKLPWKAPKKKPRKHPNHCLHLWEFLLDLLNNEEYSPKYIAWTRKDVGEFKLIRTEFIANLWGQSKRRKKMTYEKMARALRYYYKFNVLEKVPHKRLHFRFGKSILPRIFEQRPAEKAVSTSS